MLATVGTTIAKPAIADTAEDLRSVVTQARSAVCGPLHPEPLAERTAAVAIRSTYDYLNHNARAVPLADPLPVLKDLGLDVGRAKLVQGAGRTEADAIKAVLVIGYKDIPDCGYDRFGVSATYDAASGKVLTALVLAGA